MGRSQRHKMAVQNTSTLGEVYAQGRVAPGVLLGATAPVGPAGGPLKGSSVMGVIPIGWTLPVPKEGEGDAPLASKVAEPLAQDQREHGPFSLKRIEPDEEGGAWYVLDRVDIREGDMLRAEATGSSSTNGDFRAVDISNDVEGETAVYWKSPSITADIVGKGRITIL